MKIRTRVLAVVAATGMALVPAVAGASAASAKSSNQSLATVLLSGAKANGDPSYDRNGRDFDILTAAVLTVLAAKPSSPVSVLTDGDVPLTAFLPTDNAFERTGEFLGLTAYTERGLATKYVAALGVDTLEAVLLYHVVPGVTIDSSAAVAADGAELTTALGQTVRVKLNPGGLFIKDQVSGNNNPRVTIPDINAGNPQIGHGIGRVLLPSM